MTAPSPVLAFLGLPWWGWAALLYVASIVFGYYHPRIWIPIDVKAFAADGSNQSLGDTFHRHRLTWRLALAVVASLLPTIPLAIGLHPRWYMWLLPFIGLLALHGGYWTWYFNPNLSLARALDYIDKWHVSWAANASWLDKLVWHQAWEQVHGPYFPVQAGVKDEAVEQRAREIYPTILHEILWSGLTVCVLFHLLFFFFI